MHVFYTPDIASNLELPEEEAGHCLRVLRLSIGDEIMLTDGKGCFYKAVISAASGKRCQVKGNGNDSAGKRVERLVAYCHGSH